MRRRHSLALVQRSTLALSASLSLAAAVDNGARAGRKSPTSKPIDFFARAIRAQSSAPYDVLVTVVDDRTHTSRKVCIMAALLVDAVTTEDRLTKGDRARVEDQSLANKARIYHFSNPCAIEQVKPMYTEAQLATVRTRLSTYT